MRYLILSDMHGNAEALSAVLRRVRRKRFDTVLVLGDLVGYGAAPNQVVDTIRDLPWPALFVRGNHDKVVAGLDDGTNFNGAALAAARWTAKHLTPANLRFVRELPRGPRVTGDGVAFCHGSPLDEDQYVFSALDALEIFVHFPVPQVTFFGHTHLPSLLVQSATGLHVTLLRGASGTLAVQPGHRYLFNPGAIGQPRDRDPRAAYMTYESETGVLRWYRVEYDVERAQERIRQANLPRNLADRLATGS